jgi:hypothetical protein
MTGSSGLPLVGAEVVLLGTQAFNANVQSVARQILSLRPAFAAVEAANAAGVDRMAAWTDAATKASRALSGTYLQDFAKQSRAAAVEAERVAVNSGKMAAAFPCAGRDSYSHCKSLSYLCGSDEGYRD